MHAAVLVLLAHPDDEFACSPWLRRMVRDGADVRCVYLTDGGYGGQSIARRERETRRALSRLGITGDSVRFMGSDLRIGDGSLPEHLERAWEGLLDWADLEHPPAIVAMPAWEGGHQDHDAAHLLGATLAKSIGADCALQFPLYTGYRLPGPWFRVLSPLPENGPVDPYRADLRERLMALRVCLDYVSQWRTWAGLLPFFIFAMLRNGRFPRQSVRAARLNERPHPGPLLYERRRFFTYERFRLLADHFMTVNHAPGQNVI